MIPALAGVADADHYRTNVGRARWYIDPLPADDVWPETNEAWPSISAVKKVSSKDWTWTSYQRVADALARNPRTFDDCESPEDYHARMMHLNRRGMGKASDRGTNVHLYFERGLRGDSIDAFIPDEPGSEYLPAVRAFFDTYQPQLVAAEYVAINRGMHGLGYGGTGDAIITIDGDPALIVADWKSRGVESKHSAYPEEAAQVAAIATADYLIGEDAAGAPVRTPVPDLSSGLIVSIRPDGARLFPIDLELASQHWRAMHAFYAAKRDERASIGRVLPPRALVDTLTPLIEAAVDAATLDALWLANRARWKPAHTAAAVARKAALTA